MKTLQPMDALGRIPETDLHGRAVWQGIREGLWPFKPKAIHLYFEHDIDFNRYRLLAEVNFGDGYWLKYFVFLDAWDLQDDLDGTVLKATEKMRNGFRNREAEPIHKKITLGEN